MLPEGFPAPEYAQTHLSNGLQVGVTLLLLQALLFSACALKSSALPSVLAAQKLSWAEAFTEASAHACQITPVPAETAEMNSNAPILVLSYFNEHITAQ